MTTRFFQITFVIVILLLADCDAIIKHPPYPAPTDVTDVTVTPGPRSAVISWTEPENPNYLGVEISWSPDGDTLLMAAGYTSRTITGLSEEIDYTFLVRARYPSGVLSGGVSINAQPEPPGETPLRNDVSNLTAVPGPGNVQISWTEPADSDFTGVEFFWTPGGDTLIIAKGTTSRTVTDLNSDTDFTFTVRARYQSGEIASGVNVTSRPEKSWGEPEQLVASIYGTLDAPQIAINSSCEAVAVWAQDNRVYTNQYVPASGWKTAFPIDSDEGTTFSPQIAIDNSGNAIAVWYQSESSLYSIWSNRYTPDSGWGTACLIESDNTENAMDPRIAVDDSGNAIVVWYQSDGTLTDIWANNFVYGLGWGTAVLIESDNSEDAYAPQIAVDNSGNAIAVWYQSDGTQTDIWSNNYAPGLGWGTAVLIESDTTGNAIDPQIAIDDSGNAIAVWSQYDGTRQSIFANQYVPGSGWGTAALIEFDSSGDAYNPRIAVNSTGTAIAVWDDSGSTMLNTYTVWANRYVPGSGWGTANPIESIPSTVAQYPLIAIDNSGEAMALWGYNDTGYQKLLANHFSPDSGWEEASIFYSYDWGEMTEQEIAMNGSGDISIIWKQYGFPMILYSRIYQ